MPTNTEKILFCKKFLNWTGAVTANSNPVPTKISCEKIQIEFEHTETKAVLVQILQIYLLCLDEAMEAGQKVLGITVQPREDDER